MDCHLFKLAVGLLELLGRSLDKGRQSVYHRDLSREALVLHRKIIRPVLEPVALTVGCHDKCYVVLIDSLAAAQKFARGIESRGRRYRLERKRLLADLLAPEGVPRRAGINVYHLGLQLCEPLTAHVDLMKDRPRVAVGYTRLYILLNVRRHGERAVGIACNGCAQNAHTLVLVEERELEGIGKEIGIVLNVQIFIICIEGGGVVQLIDGAALGTGDEQLTSERLPARDMRGVYMQILPAEHHEHRRIVRAFSVAGENKCLVLVEVGCECAAAEDLHIAVYAAEIVAESGHRHTSDRHEHLYGPYPRVSPDIFFKPAHHALLAFAVKVQLHHLYSGIGIFKDRAGDAYGSAGHRALKDISVGRAPAEERIRHDLLYDLAYLVDGIIAERLRIDIEDHSRMHDAPAPLCGLVDLLSEGDRVTVFKLKLAHRSTSFGHDIFDKYYTFRCRIHIFLQIACIFIILQR